MEPGGAHPRLTSMRLHTPRATGLILLTGLLTATSLQAASAAGTPPDRAVSSTPTAAPSPSPGTPGQPQTVTPRPGMRNVHPVPWDRAVPDASGRRVRVEYTTGVEPCNVLDHVDVRYSRSAVTITLFEGSDPRAANQYCIQIAVQRATDVSLREPLGHRTLVDGAKSRPR
jgi:hypothetical protein